LRNQFRSLDDDEVDFLDSVLESTRAKEAAVKKDTAEQLNRFKEQQEQRERTEQVTESEEPLSPQENWAVNGRKRKRAQGKDILGIKLRKSSSTADSAPTLPLRKESVHSESGSPVEKDKETATGIQASRELTNKGTVTRLNKEDATKPSKNTTPTSVGLGLGGYSSGED